MRSVVRSRRGMWLASLLASAVLALVLAACGGSTAAATDTPGAGTPSTAATATAGSSSTVAASTRLCDLLSVSAVSAVLGGTVSTITRSKTTGKDGSTSINCVYLPSGAHVDAAISYYSAINGQSSYAADKTDDASRGETETALSGLGDAAFWAISATYANTLQLTVLKGNELLLMTLGGVGADGSTMLNGAIGLAKQALPAI